MLGDGRFNRFRVGSINDIHLFSTNEIMKGRYRPNTFPLHELGSLWGSITDDLRRAKKGNALVLRYVKIRGNS